MIVVEFSPKEYCSSNVEIDKLFKGVSKKTDMVVLTRQEVINSALSAERFPLIEQDPVDIVTSAAKGFILETKQLEMSDKDKYKFIM